MSKMSDLDQAFTAAGIDCTMTFPLDGLKVFTSFPPPRRLDLLIGLGGGFWVGTARDAAIQVAADGTRAWAQANDNYGLPIFEESEIAVLVLGVRGRFAPDAH